MTRKVMEVCEETLAKIAGGEVDPRQCPMCSSKNTLYRKRDNVTWCRRCGAEWRIKIKS